MGSFVTVFTAEEAPQFDPDQVTPGVIGFLAIAALAIATIFLVIDMNKRMRRIKFREEVREALAVEVAERDAAVHGETLADIDPAEEELAEEFTEVAAEDAEEAASEEGNSGR